MPVNLLPPSDPLANHAMRWSYRSSGRIRGSAVFHEVRLKNNTSPVYWAHIHADGSYFVWWSHPEYRLAPGYLARVPPDESKNGKCSTPDLAQKEVEAFIEEEYKRHLQAQLALLESERDTLAARLG